MKRLNLYVSACCILISGLKAATQFYNDAKISVEVDPRMYELASKDFSTNPVILDAAKNDAYLGKILSVFVNPHFVGGAPPGITTFMLTQVLLSAQKNHGTKYPLFTKEALRMMNEDNVSMNDCNKDGKKGADCKPGFKQVIVKKKREAQICKPEVTKEEKVVTTGATEVTYSTITTGAH